MLGFNLQTMHLRKEHTIKKQAVLRNYYRKMNEDDNFCEGEAKRSDDPLLS